MIMKMLLLRINVLLQPMTVKIILKVVWTTGRYATQSFWKIYLKHSSTTKTLSLSQNRNYYYLAEKWSTILFDMQYIRMITKYFSAHVHRYRPFDNQKRTESRLHKAEKCWIILLMYRIPILSSGVFHSLYKIWPIYCVYKWRTLTLLKMCIIVYEKSIRCTNMMIFIKTGD